MDEARLPVITGRDGGMCRVAFIGLGSMGGALADRAIDAGHSCILFDLDPQAADRFSGKVARASSARDAAEKADVVVACLAADEQYDALLMGPEGLLVAQRPFVYVHAGTSVPVNVHRWAAMLAGVGSPTVDAPVTGGVGRARAGRLTVMTSGPPEACSIAEPVLASYAEKIVNFGVKPGDAQLMKLLNNMLNFANLAAACEVMVMGAKAGLDPDKMLEVINSGSGQNSATLHKFPNHILTGTFDYEGWISHALKDGAAFLDLASDLSVPTPISTAVFQAFLLGGSIGDGRQDHDITEVIRHMEQAAGVQVRRKGDA